MDGFKGTTDLGTLYDDLKSNINSNRVNTPIRTIDDTSIRKRLSNECEKLKDGCRKRLIIDIYSKIIPLDTDYVDTHQGQMQNDVDAMLANKGMTATQYLTSASEKAKIPLIEYVLHMTDLIGNQFMEEAIEKIKDAKANDIEIPTPEAPNVDDKEIENQLVDVSKDSEYETFIDSLKKKTINKIVNDVSKIITDKKEEKDLSFDPKPISDQIAETESTVSVCMDYLNHKLMMEGVEADSTLYDDMIGMAIRESTLNELDVIFRQPFSDMKNISSRIRLGKGIIINESTASYISEAAKSTEEVNKVIEDAKKESERKIDSNLKASDILNAENENNKDKKDVKKPFNEFGFR